LNFLEALNSFFNRRHARRFASLALFSLLAIVAFLPPASALVRSLAPASVAAAAPASTFVPFAARLFALLSPRRSSLAVGAIASFAAWRASLLAVLFPPAIRVRRRPRRARFSSRGNRSRCGRRLACRRLRLGRQGRQAELSVQLAPIGGRAFGRGGPQFLRNGCRARTNVLRLLWLLPRFVRRNFRTNFPSQLIPF
jgi:hypothetical protein